MIDHIILKVIAKLLIPMIVLFGLYVQFHGDFGAGGGFQAGVIVASSVILFALVFGTERAMRAVPPIAVRIGAASGVLLYASVGLAGLALGGAYLDYFVLPGGQHAGIMLVEFGVLLTVSSVVLLIFYAFAGRERTDPDGNPSDGDW